MKRCEDMCLVLPIANMGLSCGCHLSITFAYQINNYDSQCNVQIVISKEHKDSNSRHKY
jgi:hypothetical protein